MTEVAVTVRKHIIAIGMILMAFVPSFTGAAESVKITLVEVQGNRRIETATVLATIKTREGEPFSPALIKRDIKELYRLGHFEDVQVKTEGFEKGLKVIFSVKEKPLIRKISFEGNDELSIEKLKEGLNLLPRTAFNIPLLHENAENIRLKYLDIGYYNAVVVPVIKVLRNGDRSVVFYIEEGERIKLRKIIITGNTAISTDTIKDALKNKEYGFSSFFGGRRGSLRPQELTEDVDTIRNLYYNKGYIQLKVDEPVIEENVTQERSFPFFGALKTVTKKDELVLRIHIHEGDQFQIASITFRGNTMFSGDQLLQEMHLKPGTVFSRDTLKKDVAGIMDRYDGIARPFASVVPLFNINSAKKAVDINVRIREGGEVRIGRIDITGNYKTRDKVIRREMRLDEGDLYSKKALKRSYERIYNLNFFENVDVVPERRGGEPMMDLNVKVKEKLTGNFSLGGGYSSVDGFIALTEVTQGNFGGRGQLLKFKTQLGGTRRIFIVSFMEPSLFDKPLWGKVDLYDQVQEYDGYSLESKGFALGTGKRFGEYISSSIRYSFDRSRVIDLETTAPTLLTDQNTAYGTNIATSSITMSLSRDSRDFYLDPKKGAKNSIYVEYAGGPLGGDPEFVKASVDSGWYFPLFWDTVLLIRGRFGYAASLNDKPLPVGERFYVGGTSTVRGFKYGAAGPMDPVLEDDAQPYNPGTNDIVDYNRLGGTSQLIFNVEYGFPIFPSARLKGVIFYDVGRAFDDSLSDPPNEPSLSLSELRQSVGYGFRWFTPLGPLRFEWGYILGEKPEDQTSRFEFSIGTMF
ncbi:MAG TPA: outer membrane protein assembly factor BamA [Nitrospiraceae bacterium]|nr:outer membrane protein assembly factor BamA [Nitrospiraceae bacterium]